MQRRAHGSRLSGDCLGGREGNPAAQTALGKMYRDGDGVEQDYAKAACWYRLASDQRNPEAQGALAALYLTGNGVPQNSAEAVPLALLGGENGDLFAQYLLGTLYYLGTGTGVVQDYLEAARWYGLAAEQGEAAAQVDLGNMYLNGYVTGQPDYILAHMWLNIAAARGLPWAAFQRDDVAREHLTIEQILEAQRFAREWMAAHPTH